jgi:hypothetical protein
MKAGFESVEGEAATPGIGAMTFDKLTDNYQHVKKNFPNTQITGGGVR